MEKPVEYGNDRIVHYKLQVSLASVHTNGMSLLNEYCAWQVNDDVHTMDNVATSFELHSCVPCHLYCRFVMIHF